MRTASGDVIKADAVVVNADLAAAEPKLLGSESRSDYANSRYSTSSITFLWALDRRFEQLQHHNVFLSEDKEDDDDPFYQRGTTSCRRGEPQRRSRPTGSISICVVIVGRTRARRRPTATRSWCCVQRRP